MALGRWQATITDNAGNVVSGASVEVRDETTNTLVQLYSDRAGSSSIGNPVTADSEGFVAFHVAGGAYKITATSGAFERIWRYVAIGTNAERDFAAATDELNLSATGAIKWDGTTWLQGVSGELQVNNAALTFGSSSNFRMGGAATPVLGGTTARLAVQGTTANSASASVTRFSNNASPPVFSFGKSRGASTGTNTIVQVNDLLGTIEACGGDGTNYDIAAFISFGVDATPGSAGDATDMPGFISFGTTPDGSATPSTRWLVLNTGTLHAATATGTVTGNGQINAVGVFDDGVLLTSMPLSAEFEKTGDFSVEDWEKKNKQVREGRVDYERHVVNGQAVYEKVKVPSEAVVPEHTAARRLKAIIDDGVDLRDPRQFIARIKKDKVLPGMPTEKEWKKRGGKISLGEMQSSLWASVDLLAVMVEKLCDRIDSLEAQLK